LPLAIELGLPFRDLIGRLTRQPGRFFVELLLLLALLVR
jgi:hypothetical protein